MGGKKSVTKGEATREMVLNAARTVFSRQPYHAASIRMIARQGGFYHGLIRYHFSSKAAIFEVLTKKSSQELRAANKTWIQETAGLDAREGLSLYLDRFIAHYEDHPEVFRTMVQNIPQDDPANIPGYRHLTELLAGTRADAEETGILPFDQDSTTRFLESFNAMIIHYLGSASAEARLLGLKPESPAYLKWVKDTMMFIFLPVLEKSLTKDMGRKGEKK
jgi:AcrR family transcriptional regulator